MHTRPLSARLGLVATTIAALTLLAGPAFAHVTANPGEAEAGGFARFAFRVSHGCDGSPTTALSIQIPDGMTSVKPEFIPGWEVETVIGELAEPVESHGETITEGVREVTWAGGPPIPDDQFFEFGLSARMPDGEPGDVVYFPNVQTCEQGETAWIQIPAEGEDGHDLDEPAPGVTLVAAEDGHGDESADDHGGDEAAGEPGDEAGDDSAAPAIAEDDGAAAGTGVADDAELVSAAGADQGGSPAEPMVYAALALGAIGLLAGGGALWRTR